MSFNVIATDNFERKLKRLAKKYKTLAVDLATLVEQLSENPTLGKPIGKDCYKIRLVFQKKEEVKVAEVE